MTTFDVPFSTWHGSDVDVSMVSRQLGRMWHELASETSSRTPVRTSLYNLIVCVENEDAAHHVSDSLSRLTQRQPSRAIVLAVDRFQARPSLDAELAVQCHGGAAGRSLCHEQVLITARGRSADHLDSIAISLLDPELPTYLWWPGQPPFNHRTFHRLLGTARQLIVDSAEFLSPGDGLAGLAAVCNNRRGVNDLNWARLEPWRETIAQFFDPVTYRPYADGISSIRLEFGSGHGDFHRSTVGILLVLGWAAQQLGWEPETALVGVVDRDVDLALIHDARRVPVHVEFRNRGEQMAARLCGIELSSEPDDLAPARFVVDRTQDLEHAHVSVHMRESSEVSRIVPIQPKDDADLMGDELETSGTDPLYGKVVDMASRIAGREYWSLS